MTRRPTSLLATIGITMFALISATQPSHGQPVIAAPTPVFQSGKDGYHTYRIPALAVTTKGTLLAFCEGRKHASNDSGDIDLLIKRSVDGGNTWSAQQIVRDDEGNTCGNPCVVVDQTNHTIWLLSTWNRGDDHEASIIGGKSKDTRRVFVMHSTDDGLSWSAPIQITDAVKQADWTWYATGPGSGIQMESGPYRGRLVIPCDHIEATSKRYYSHVIFSDDHGKSWHRGGSTPRDQVNECQVVELSHDRLMLNMRNYDRSQPLRRTSISNDGGMTWSDPVHAPTLIEPICQAAIERMPASTSSKPHIILFCNPADARQRINMTVRASDDDGLSWPRSLTLYAGPSGYSDLDVLPNKKIVCLHEAGTKNLAESIVFSSFPLQALQPTPATTP